MAKARSRTHKFACLLGELEACPPRKILNLGQDCFLITVTITIRNFKISWGGRGGGGGGGGNSRPSPSV